MTQTADEEDDYGEPRFSSGSISCLFPLKHVDSPRKSISYNKLLQQPLTLIVVKLDGSSFGIEVEKMGRVGDAKRAVEAAFHHLPKKGPGRVSWEHVWGQFCLCHEGQKLLVDSDYISMFGINDGDQLHFVRHASTTYNLARKQSKKEDPDSDSEPCISDGHRDKKRNSKKDDDHHMEISDDCAESGDDVISRCEHRSAPLLRGRLPYCKLTSSDMRIQERSSSSRFSHKILRKVKNCLLFSSSKKACRRETWKRR